MTVIVLAALALGIFCCWKRQRNRQAHKRPIMDALDTKPMAQLLSAPGQNSSHLNVSVKRSGLLPGRSNIKAVRSCSAL